MWTDISSHILLSRWYWVQSSIPFNQYSMQFLNEEGQLQQSHFLRWWFLKSLQDLLLSGQKAMSLEIGDSICQIGFSSSHLLVSGYISLIYPFTIHRYWCHCVGTKWYTFLHILTKSIYFSIFNLRIAFSLKTHFLFRLFSLFFFSDEFLLKIILSGLLTKTSHIWWDPILNGRGILIDTSS